MAFRPYLFFGGNCREAFTRYQEIFGGDLTLMTMKDVPGEEPPADQAEMIIHAALTVGEDLLMASDDPMADSFGPVQGMMVSYDAADAADAKRIFDALGDGGTSPRRSSRPSSRRPSACASTVSARPGWSSVRSRSSRPDRSHESPRTVLLTTRAYPPTFCAVGVVFVGTGGSGKPTMAGVSCAQVVTRAEGVARIDAGTTPGLNQVLGMDHRPSGRCRVAG